MSDQIDNTKSVELTKEERARPSAFVVMIAIPFVVILLTLFAHLVERLAVWAWNWTA